MASKKKILVFLLIPLLVVAILVPLLLLRGPDTPPPSPKFIILSPSEITYYSTTTQITINITTEDIDLPTIWYRLYNETASTWVDPVNVTWSVPTVKTLGQGGEYTLYAWANDSAGLTWTANVSFTMFHEFVYDGDTIISGSLTVGPFQKVIFRNGVFSVGGTLAVYGLFEMLNATFTGELNTYEDSVSVIQNSSLGSFSSWHDSVIHIEDSSITTANNYASQNSSISLTNCVFSTTLWITDTTTVMGTNVTLYRLYQYDNSEVTLSDGAFNEYSYIHDDAVLSLSNFSTYNFINFDGRSVGVFTDHSTNSPLYIEENASLTLIDSTVLSMYVRNYLTSGNLTIDNRVISGIGSVSEPSLTLINTTPSQLDDEYYVIGTTNASILNTIVDLISVENQAHTDIYNCSIFELDTTHHASATIVNSSLIVLELMTNSTVFIENSTVSSFIDVTSDFRQGTIYGFNTTFTGVEDGDTPSLTIGSSVNYNDLRYSYDVRNQVQLTLVNTTDCQRIYGFNTANITLQFCDVIYSYMWMDANLTCFNSTFQQLYGQSNNNLTLFNSTISYRLHLYSTSYALITQSSWVSELRYQATAGYLVTPDSYVGTYTLF